MPLDADAARTVVAALDLGEATIDPLGQGFASEAWLRPRRRVAVSPSGSSGPDAGYPSTYRAEHGVMAAPRRSAGAAVPRPVAGSWTVRAGVGPTSR